jgi:hypothetical protein
VYVPSLFLALITPSSYPGFGGSLFTFTDSPTEKSFEPESRGAGDEVSTGVSLLAGEALFM